MTLLILSIFISDTNTVVDSTAKNSFNLNNNAGSFVLVIFRF